MTGKNNMQVSLYDGAVERPKDRDNPVIVITDPGSCRQCRWRITGPHFHVEFMGAEARRDGWTLRGEVRYISVRCASCGSAYEAAVRLVPIEAAPFKCPNCGSNEGLRYSVTSLAGSDNSFELEAMITCPKCHNRENLKKAIAIIFGSMKVRVSRDGVAVTSGERD